MGNRLFVGNLSFKATEDEVRELFKTAGEVKDCHLVMDRDTQRPRGFGFVEMATQAEATAAVDKLNGHDFQGRDLNVSEARPRAEGGAPRGGSNFRGGNSRY
jgi:RNA recognition motif-containing protein